MPKRKLEQVMSDFYHRRNNVLVCTTIIETGIDVPNANTIIMDRADKLGLAQLHQLRGRVGRSHRQAYAYLLTPEPRSMTDDARKRLEAIEAAGELGIGFSLAMHDLEIRGAGELLGEDQSGQMESIGFSLYMDMLDRAVKAIKDGKTPDLAQPLGGGPEVNLRLPALIPENYLPDVHMRLIMYKRIASAENEDALDDLRVEMIDRFGLLPDPLKNLFRVTQLKLTASELGIARIDFGQNGGKLEFHTDTRVDPLALVRLVQTEPNSFRLEGGTRLRMTKRLEQPEQRFDAVNRLLVRLRPPAQHESGNRKAAAR
jgi:transcription-repair coupling factor (superfamily II helicase)